MDRIDKINYYLDIAQTVMERGTVLHRNFGSIIVRDDVIVSTGFSHMVRQDGAPRGRGNSTDLNYCTREKLQVPRGERYERCRVEHAEATAIIAAPQELMRGATLYLVGRDMQTGDLLTDTWPCMMCLRLIIKAGIVQVVNRISPTDYNVVHVGLDWVKNTSR